MVLLAIHVARAGEAQKRLRHLPEAAGLVREKARKASCFTSHTVNLSASGGLFYVTLLPLIKRREKIRRGKKKYSRSTSDMELVKLKTKQTKHSQVT